jgi:hypothetical protein
VVVYKNRVEVRRNEVWYVTNHHEIVDTVVSGQLNVVRSLKGTNQIISLERTQHMIGLWTIPVRIYLARDHSST